jgi:hypothetical protein
LRTLRTICDKSARYVVAVCGQLRVVTALLMAARTASAPWRRGWHDMCKTTG